MYSTAYCLLHSLVEHSGINPKSLAFGYLDEKPIDTGLMKLLGLCLLPSLTLLVVALFTEVELPTAPDHSHDHIPLHGIHWYLHLDFFLSGIQTPYADD
ncbi:hypothetical protein B296_00038886 [Ensete ventricosum]|uniref:Uncharacterized protein n=1 Tax=Ensete ventricosum TaxID=4639 RepID=A0A426XLL1_ENSVE|nr:hypothetical protein B296_00038886 [Ensete ventricosum]